MQPGTLVSVEDYLNTSYRPDCDYIDGVVLERNVGERDHSELQGEILAYLHARRKEWNIWVYPEQRVQISATRFRVPDICVVLGARPAELIFRTPPFLCIEILSKDDRMGEMQERIDDYLKFGVAFVWVVDPRIRKGYIYNSDGSRQAKDGVLKTSRPEIAVPLDDIFRALE